MRKFGEVLKKIRLKNGDSLRVASEKTGIIFSYIDKIERGMRPINKDIFETFLKLYPEDSRELTVAFIEETMPECIATKILNGDSSLSDESEDKELFNFLLKNSSAEGRKSALELMVLQMELEARKNGTYKDNEEELNILKEKISKL